MNELSLNQETMSSIEIAELTEKQHAHVLRDIRVMLSELHPDLDDTDIKDVSITYNADKSKTLRVDLNEDYTMTLITGYSIKLRHKVNKRWRELENKKPPTALELAKQNVKLLEALEIKDTYIIASNEASIKAGEVIIREFVKSTDIIDIGEKLFYKWMRDQKIILQNCTEPYQGFVTRGFFTYRPSEEKINGKFRHTLRVTARGKVWLAAKYMKSIEE